LSDVQAEDAEVFGRAAAVLAIELRLLKAQDFAGRDTLLVLVVEALLNPFRVADIGPNPSRRP
jgi:hypothetical protein